MTNEIGFDSEKYLRLQSEHIEERISKFDKLYLEFGGKLYDDFHASRVLPGFHPDNKLKMLEQLKDQAEIVIVISADAIEQNKVRGDLGITYDLDVLRLIDAFRGNDLYVGSVVLTHYTGQAAAEAFSRRLENLGVKVYYHYIIEGYPLDVENIVSTANEVTAAIDQAKVDEIVSSLSSVSRQLSEVDWVELTDNINTVATDAQASLADAQEALQKVKDLDIESLNQAITDLQAVVEPLAAFTKRFG